MLRRTDATTESLQQRQGWVASHLGGRSLVIRQLGLTGRAKGSGAPGVSESSALPSPPSMHAWTGEWGGGRPCERGYRQDAGEARWGGRMLGRLKQADRTAAVRPLKRARAEGSARAWTRSVLTSRRACMVALAASSQRLLMAQAALSVTHGSLQARIRPPPPPPLCHIARPPAKARLHFSLFGRWHTYVVKCVFDTLTNGWSCISTWSRPTIPAPPLRGTEAIRRCCHAIRSA